MSLTILKRMMLVKSCICDGEIYTTNQCGEVVMKDMYGSEVAVGEQNELD